MKIEKGQPGYIKSRKMKYLLWTVLEFGIVIAVFLLGYFQAGSRMNLLTVAAIVGCLPASKMLVEFITMAPYQSIDPEIYQEIEEKGNLITTVYDLIITSKEKVMPAEAFVISGHVVCGYTSDPKTDETALAKHIKTMLQNNHYEKMTVKIFHDYTAFLSRAEGMNNIASIEHPDGTKQDQDIRKLLLSISM